jgi:hypothetical protein
MKATIDIPDDLYRRVKAKTALKGRAVRDVTIELYRKWVEESDDLPVGTVEERKSWVDELRNLQIPPGTPGPTAREILEEGRNRLEPKGTE